MRMLVHTSAVCNTVASMGNNSYHLEMRLSSCPTCDLGLLIRGITLSVGIPYEINVRTGYTDQHGTHWVADHELVLSL